MSQSTTDYRWAVSELLERQKTSKGAPAYSRFVNRPLGRRLAAVAYVLQMTPNQVTAVSAIFTFTGIFLIVLFEPFWWVTCLAAFLLVLGYALDSADGQLARLQGGGSAAGEWLDHIVDAVKTSVLHLAILVCWYRFYDLDHVWLLIPLMFQAVASVLFFSMILTDQLRRLNRGGTGHFRKGEGNSSVLYSLAVVPTDYGLMCLTFALLFWQSAFPILYGLLLVANLGFLTLALGKWFREVRSLG